jgi:hypothetical protein
MTTEERSELKTTLAWLAADLADLAGRVRVLATVIAAEGPDSDPQAVPLPPGG